MSSIVLEPGVKERLLADCRDFLRSEDWYVTACYFAFTAVQWLMRFPGMLKGVNSFVNTMHVKMQIFMVLSHIRKGVPFRRGYLLHGVPGRYYRIKKRRTCADSPV